MGRHEMRVLNRSETVALGRSGEKSVEAVVQVIGVDARVGARGFIFERRDPRVLVLRGEDDVMRMALPRNGQDVLRLVAPVAGYLLARRLMRRRRKS